MKVWVPIELPEKGVVLNVVYSRTGAGLLQANILGDPVPDSEISINSALAEPKRERWEYKRITTGTITVVNELGAEGWECFAGDAEMAWLKRRLP